MDISIFWQLAIIFIWISAAVATFILSTRKLGLISTPGSPYFSFTMMAILVLVVITGPFGLLIIGLGDFMVKKIDALFDNCQLKDLDEKA